MRGRGRRPGGVLPRGRCARWPRVAERLRGAEPAGPAARHRPARPGGAPRLRARRAAGGRRRGLLRSLHRRGRDPRAAQRGAGGRGGRPRARARPRPDDLRAYDRARHAATRDKFRLNRLLQRDRGLAGARERGRPPPGAAAPTSPTTWWGSPATSCRRGRRSGRGFSTSSILSGLTEAQRTQRTQTSDAIARGCSRGRSTPSERVDGIRRRRRSTAQGDRQTWRVASPTTTVAAYPR